MIDQPDQAIFVILTPAEAEILHNLNINKATQAAARKDYISAQEYKVRAELMQLIAEGGTESPVVAPTDRKERLGAIMGQADEYAFRAVMVVSIGMAGFKETMAGKDAARGILADMIEDLITNQQEKP